MRVRQPVGGRWRWCCKGKLCSLSHPRLQVKQQSPRDVVVVVGLVEEDVLAVAPIRSKVLEDTVLANAVLGAQLLPELRADCTRGHTAGQKGAPKAESVFPADALWLPHWPTWQVMISRGTLRAVPLLDVLAPRLCRRQLSLAVGFSSPRRRSASSQLPIPAHSWRERGP